MCGNRWADIGLPLECANGYGGDMITREEVEKLAVLLSRAGVSWYEAAWANMVMDKLRALALEQEALPKVVNKLPDVAKPETD